MSKLPRSLTSSLLIIVLLFSVSILTPGCAHKSPAYATNTYTPSVNKNGPPYTKYPHLGRNHFNRVPFKSSGGC